MSVKYIRIFVDELVIIASLDGTIYRCVMESSKNDLDMMESLSPDLQELYTITVTMEGKEYCDIKIRNILSIERMN
ncbi:hypothetical protein F8C76_02125 [Flagellimonas olearia]|uniref:Uncharacterized protein n=1 Tax=Flagellimonas olearia TaxID=552546 RepID=A0A6I1DZP3_9FLAO|nr:hypothetical protein [Allomuricauda olearia]KAB7530327.1 hypothetical protein F8C76_02125 [Allomuricauda olearia]